MLEDGRPRLDADGATVGGFRTMVEAVAMRVVGLGGDSEVRWVPHLVSQLEGPRASTERILVIDSREDGFLRQHTRGSLSILREVANHLVETGWIDRIVEGPGDGDAAAAQHRRWFGIPAPRAPRAAPSYGIRSRGPYRWADVHHKHVDLRAPQLRYALRQHLPQLLWTIGASETLGVTR